MGAKSTEKKERASKGKKNLDKPHSKVKSRARSERRQKEERYHHRHKHKSGRSIKVRKESRRKQIEGIL